METKINVINEPGRDIPVVGAYDVAVAGGWMVGFTAAIGAARKVAVMAIQDRLIAGGVKPS